MFTNDRGTTSKEMHPFTGTIKRVTEKAFLMDCGGDEAVWLPKSKVELDENFLVDELDNGNIGETIDFMIPAWLAEEKGLM